MRKIVALDGRSAIVEHLVVPGTLVIPFRDAAYVAVLWDCDGSFDAVARNEVTVALIESGCGYIVCGGSNCEQWHDDADLAWVSLDLASNSAGSMPIVMTSWHSDETEEDVVKFALSCTDSAEQNFKTFLFLVVGQGTSSLERIEHGIESALVR